MFPEIERLGSCSVLSLFSILLISISDCGLTLVHNSIEAYSCAVMELLYEIMYILLKELVNLLHLLSNEGFGLSYWDFNRFNKFSVVM